MKRSDMTYLTGKQTIRNLKELYKTNDLFISLSSLFYLLIPWKFWPRLGRKCASFLNVLSARLSL